MARPAIDSLAFRTRLAGFFTVLAVTAILVRLFDLQLRSPVVEPEVSERKATREMPWKPRRGLILDRNHRQLVRNDDKVTLKVELNRIEDRVAVARALAPILSGEGSLGYEEILKAIPVDSRDVKEGLTREKNLVRNLSPAAVEALKNLVIPGLENQEPRYVQEGAGEIWRYRLPVRGLNLAGFPDRTYLKKELAAQVIGFVNAENEGRMGVEEIEDKQLLAQPIRIQVRRYGDRRAILQSDYTRGVPQRGADVVLTLDETIQWLAERALYDQCDKFQARVGVAIVMDPMNGDILALANYPPFEAARKGTYGSEEENNRHGSNHAITALFEPGSTFKPFIVAAGLDLGVITEESEFDLENGTRRVPGRTKPIKDVTKINRRMADVPTILIVSSNVGVGKIAEEIIGARPAMAGRQDLYKYLRGFGFGGPTGIGLPGETSMYFRPRDPMQWRYLDILPLAFGAGPVMVSPIGLATAYCSLANGGIRVPPRIVDGYAGNVDGKYYPNPIPSGERVVKKEVADSVRGMLEKVVERERSQARSEWYKVGGKTGTALKWVDGGYSEKHRLLSFAGIAPIDDPRVVVLVMIDEAKRENPSDHSPLYGNEVSAPVFRRIVDDTLAYLNVPPDRIPKNFPTPTTVPTPRPTETPLEPSVDTTDPALLADPGAALDQTLVSPATGGGFLSVLERISRSLGGEVDSAGDAERLAGGGSDR